MRKRGMTNCLYDLVCYMYRTNDKNKQEYAYIYIHIDVYLYGLFVYRRFRAILLYNNCCFEVNTTI